MIILSIFGGFDSRISILSNFLIEKIKIFICLRDHCYSFSTSINYTGIIPVLY